MRTTMVIALVLVLAACVLVLPGCGDNGEEAVQESEYVDLDEPVSQGIVGVFYESTPGESTEGKKSIAFEAGGTFGGDAWGTSKKGTYEVTDSEEGNYVTLTFDDGTTEKWGVGISMGKVVAVTSPDGYQYNKQDAE